MLLFDVLIYLYSWLLIFRLIPDYSLQAYPYPWLPFFLFLLFILMILLFVLS
ncbi:hypothetical protein V1511DRAFT_493275 [Dipodascopsis uninucleata]